MSETDSFIEEVSEEVRRDRLFGTFKRYGWIVLLAVLVIVGAAAYNEWNKARIKAANQMSGDEILKALEMETPEARADALSGISTEDRGKLALIKLQEASMLVEDERIDEAVAVFEGVEAMADTHPIYADLAKLKLVMLQPDAEMSAKRIEDLNVVGRPFRLMALEQRALSSVRGGQTDAALEDFKAILEDPETSQDLRERASRLTVVLGGEVPQQATLLPTSEE